MSLVDALIPTLPASAYYIPNFISPEEEAIILSKIQSAPKPRWKQLSHRRLQPWPSDLVRNTLLDAPLPPWLKDPIVGRLLLLHNQEGHVFANSPHGRPNHVLVNEYPPGVGIMPHKDGPAYHPVVCTISLNTSLCLNIHRPLPDGALEPAPAWRILQEPRSLLITTGELYTDYLHGIDGVDADVDLGPETVVNWDMLGDGGVFVDGRNERGVRISLTYRDVVRVSKAGGLFKR